MSSTVSIQPYLFVHVLDLTSNVTRLEVGPQTLILQTNEQLTAGPVPCIIIPPGCYCVVDNPISNYEHGKRCQLKYGYKDIRFYGDPFPLYPGETLPKAPNYFKTLNYQSSIEKLPIVKADHALRLRAVVDHVDGDTDRKAGDMWQIEGPCTYHPTPETQMLGEIKPEIIKAGQAVLVRAKQGLTDRNGRPRVTGEEWFVRREGAYLSGVYEEVCELRQAFTLSANIALHLKAKQTLKDALKKSRNAGDEWLVTSDDVESYIPEVGEEIVSSVNRTILPKRTYCVVLNPVGEDGKNQLGKRQLRTGISSFFLQPGELLELGVQKSHVLSQDEGVVLKARLGFIEYTNDKKTIKRSAGDCWMLTGPVEYIPPIEVEIVNTRKAIPLNKNEGVYVRDTKTGKIRAVMGPQAYMMTTFEILWEKELIDNVEILLRQGGGHGAGDIRKMAYYEQSIDPSILKGRDKTRTVSYRCPHNCAVQVYNYKNKTARVVFGPDLIVLGPHENFNVLNLSAGKPKKEKALQSLCLMLGPDFITDILEVETSDHARLQVKIGFNNHFQWTRGDAESEAKLFSVPDFIGYACRQIASRIRGQVAQIPFDEFHRHSATAIQAAVFGTDKDNKVKKELKFEANNMIVSSVDVQSIEPVDINMRASLTKSVQMAIEISTKSVEAAAAHEAERMEQIARGHLEQQKLLNEREAERERALLYSLQADTAAVESSGQAQAEARAIAEKMLIECQTEIEVARLKALAAEIQQNSELEAQDMMRTSELNFVRCQNQLEVERSKSMVEIEVRNVSRMIGSLGQETIINVAKAGPETQVKLLKSLGIESVLLTDGKSPINLFNTADGLVGAAK